MCRFGLLLSCPKNQIRIKSRRWKSRSLRLARFSFEQLSNLHEEILYNASSKIPVRKINPASRKLSKACESLLNRQHVGSTGGGLAPHGHVGSFKCIGFYSIFCVSGLWFYRLGFHENQDDGMTVSQIVIRAQLAGSFFTLLQRPSEASPSLCTVRTAYATSLDITPPTWLGKMCTM